MKFAKELVSAAQAGRSIAKDKRRMLLLMGLPASGISIPLCQYSCTRFLDLIVPGKSFLAQEFEKRGWKVASDAAVGSTSRAEWVKFLEREFARDDARVVVDRPNLTTKQRGNWVSLAHRLGVGRIDLVFVDTPAEVCRQRMRERTKNDAFEKHFKECVQCLRRPQRNEGLAEIKVITQPSQIPEIVDVVTNLQ